MLVGSEQACVVAAQEAYNVSRAREYLYVNHSTYFAISETFLEWALVVPALADVLDSSDEKLLR